MNVFQVINPNRVPESLKSNDELAVLRERILQYILLGRFRCWSYRNQRDSLPGYSTRQLGKSGNLQFGLSLYIIDHLFQRYFIPLKNWYYSGSDFHNWVG